MQVTLQLLDGRKMIFKDVKNISIIEEHLQNSKPEKKTTQFTRGPKEGNWFNVDPLAIDQSLFKEKRIDSKQERTRQYILEAFEEMKKDSKYTRPYKTMMPEKTWETKKVEELKELAKSIGDHNADWVEQALEWAQRIENGESWAVICNKGDTANWYRLVVWKEGKFRLVGGSHDVNVGNYPASYVYNVNYFDYDDVEVAVPLVVSYDV